MARIFLLHFEVRFYSQKRLGSDMDSKNYLLLWSMIFVKKNKILHATMKKQMPKFPNVACLNMKLVTTYIVELLFALISQMFLHNHVLIIHAGAIKCCLIINDHL